MLRKSIKKVCMIMLITTLMLGYFLPDVLIAKVSAATDTLEVTFDNSYAQVGQELSVSVQGATEVSYQWFIDGKEISNPTDCYTPTNSDLEKWIEVIVSADGENASAKLYCSKLPVVYIDTENGADIVSKEDYINATMRIQGNAKYSDADILYDGDIEIRGRGNSTWSMPKKPYKIKLDKKSDIFNMGKNKHWVLLANYSDESLMRNTLAYDFSGSLGMEHMSTVWVDVILNGEYVGNYQFCEQIRVDSTRVDIFDWEGFAEDSAAVIAEAAGVDEDDLAEYMLENMSWITSGQVEFNGAAYNIFDYPDIQVPSINGGYLLELDEYYDEFSKFKTKSNQPIMFKNPEFVATNEDMMTYVQDYIQAFEEAVQSSDYTAMYEDEMTHYSDLFDFDALVDYWLINEIFYNEEFNKKSTYMYKEIDDLMMMGPMWDMDYSSGGEGLTGATDKWATLSFSATNAQANMWYKYLVKDPYFLMKVQERYWEIRDVQIEGMIGAIDEHYELLKESGNANSVRWPRQTFESDVAGLKTWLNAHIVWLDKQMTTESSLDVSFLTKDIDLKLTLVNTNGTALEIDDTDHAPADAVVLDGKDVILQIDGSENITGTAKIYVNSKLVDSVPLNSEKVVYLISSDKLSSDIGEKNVIEVKVNNKTNYITVKEIACGHKDTSIETVTEPSCTEVGTDREVCLICGGIVTEKINTNALGHDWDDGYTVDVEPTYEKEGSKSIHCNRCIEKKDVTVIPKLENPFTDVSEESRFCDEILWAYENGITTGKTATTFEPMADCTRGQVVTFLWRAEGGPEPTITENPFTDVAETSPFYKAILWAYENGITTGKTATTFQPDTVVTREQFVTFLWRNEGKPASTAENPFVDVVEDRYSTPAILWAYENRITTGKTETTFLPSASLIRQHVVTFLYRAYN